MKNYHITFSLAICVLFITIMLSIIGCGTYIEGDGLALQSFKKMTVQEKTMYDAVEKEWWQEKLVAVRSAVGKRDITPRENSTPFIDIANIIKTNNNVSLKLDQSGWNTDHKNRAIKCRWDRLDEDWYRTLLLSIGVKDYKVQELIKEESKEIKELEPEPETYGDVPYITPQNEIVKINIKNIIPESKYDELYYRIKYCEDAVYQYKQIVDDRLLTYDDYELLIRISIQCKANQISNKLTEWRN